MIDCAAYSIVRNDVKLMCLDLAYSQLVGVYLTAACEMGMLGLSSDWYRGWTQALVMADATAGRRW